MKKGLWGNSCPICDAATHPIAANEDSLPNPSSIYAATKLAQESMALVHGRTYGTERSSSDFKTYMGRVKL